MWKHMESIRKSKETLDEIIWKLWHTQKRHIWKGEHVRVAYGFSRGWWELSLGYLRERGGSVPRLPGDRTSCFWTSNGGRGGVLYEKEITLQGNTALFIFANRPPFSCVWWGEGVARKAQCSSRNLVFSLFLLRFSPLPCPSLVKEGGRGCRKRAKRKIAPKGGGRWRGVTQKKTVPQGNPALFWFSTPGKGGRS